MIELDDKDRVCQEHIAQLIKNASKDKEAIHIANVIGGPGGRQKIGFSEERVTPIIPIIREYISYWREYPDMFVDFLQTGWREDKELKLKFYFYQRVFLRAAIRYKYVYFVFPRAYSKSFLSVMVLMIRCILYPRSKLFVTSGGKERNACSALL